MKFRFDALLKKPGMQVWDNREAVDRSRKRAITKTGRVNRRPRAARVTRALLDKIMEGGK